MTDPMDNIRAAAPPHGDVPPDWFEAAFGELYPVVYVHRTAEAAAPEAAFAAALASLGPGDSALDLCCGTGRHMGHLLGFGARVTGVDYSASLLRRARIDLGHDIRLVRADMRCLPFGPGFDAVFNFFTSFGYFGEEDENRRAAQEMARVLKPGGRLFMDYMNAACDVPRLVARSERMVGERRIMERRWYDSARRRVNKTIEVLRDGRPEACLNESVRAYDRDELVALLNGAGLEVVKTFGACDGRAFGADTPRLILLAVKRDT